MKLPKETRKELREAASKQEAISIEWPASAPECEIGRRYALSHFTPDARLRVERRHKAECESGWEAEVRLDHDPTRSLHMSARKGPEDPSMGGPQFRSETEPEQVDARYQRLLDMEGRQKTAMMGERQREMHEGIRREAHLAREHRKGNAAGASAAKRRLDRLNRRLDAST